MAHTHSHTTLHNPALPQTGKFQTILIDFLNQAIHVYYYYTESITIDRSPAINGAKVNSLFIHVLTVLSIMAILRKGLVNSMDMNRAMMKSPLPLRTL